MIEHSPLRILVTGGCGFIGSNFIRYWLDTYPNDQIVNFDLLTYAGNRANLTEYESDPRYSFIQGDITDAVQVDSAMADCTHVVHFAAESHVDRSITAPELFLNTNVIGTHVLLSAAIKHKVKRFHHISTDEVFGSLELNDPDQFSELTPYAPRSPYSASKAASDMLVRSYADTYQLPFTITNCSNNYGPYQFPEKFIPLVITNALDDLPVPIYGDGLQVRDWLEVKDHCWAIEVVLLKANDNETFVVGGLTEDVTNIDIARLILSAMKKPDSLIKHVTDRPGHDVRYAVNWSKIKQTLDWQPSVTLEQGLDATIRWYTDNRVWWEPLKNAQQAYFQQQYSSMDQTT